MVAAQLMAYAKLLTLRHFHPRFLFVASAVFNSDGARNYNFGTDPFDIRVDGKEDAVGEFFPKLPEEEKKKFMLDPTLSREKEKQSS